MFAFLSRHSWRKSGLFCAAFAATFAVSFFAFAQVTPAPTDILGQLVAAAQAKQWLMFSAVAIGFVVAATKTGWLGTWLQSKIPSAALPYWAMVLGFAGTFSVDTVAGKPWQQSLLDGFSGLLAAFIAIAGHQTIVEHMRAGKEILPKAPWASPPTPPTGTVGQSGPPVVVNCIAAPSAPASKRTETLTFPKRLATAALAGVLSITAFATTGAAAGVALPGCTAAQWQTFVTDAQNFIAYVEAVLPGLEALWAIVQPLIPAASQAAVTAAYNDAMLSLTNSLSAFQDAVQAGTAAQQAPANFAQLFTSVQDAFQSVYNIVTKWQSLAPSSSAQVGAAKLGEHAAKIATWRRQ